MRTAPMRGAACGTFAQAPLVSLCPKGDNEGGAVQRAGSEPLSTLAGLESLA